MLEEWYLFITFYVLQKDGVVDQRQLHPMKQETHISCELEANARIDLFTPQIGNDRIRRFSSAYSCGYGGCRSPNYDKTGGTYEIGLNGTLVGFVVGCEKKVTFKERRTFPPK